MQLLLDDSSRKIQRKDENLKKSYRKHTPKVAEITLAFFCVCAVSSSLEKCINLTQIVVQGFLL